MKQYLKVYKKLLFLNFAWLTAYRANLVNYLVSSAAWGVFSIVSILLITRNTSYVLGWTREEIVFLTATYAILIGLFHMLFSNNFDRLANIIHFGELDTILLKPLDAQFLVSCWLFSYAHAVRFLMGLGLAIYLIFIGRWDVTLGAVLVYFILIFIGLMLLYSIWLMVMTLTTWFTRLSNLVEVMYTVSGIGRYPLEVFRELGLHILFVLLPVLLTINTPARLILQKPVVSYILILSGLAAIFVFLSRKFWIYALRFYTSASS